MQVKSAELGLPQANPEDEFKRLDEFKQMRAKQEAAKAEDRFREKRGPPRRIVSPPPSVATTSIGLSEATAAFTQVPQYAGREEALLAKKQSPEDDKKERTEVGARTHALTRATTVAHALTSPRVLSLGV
jgi:hypothetical protein